MGNTIKAAQSFCTTKLSSTGIKAEGISTRGVGGGKLAKGVDYCRWSVPEAEEESIA